MNFIGRFRFLFGVMAVVLLVALLTLYLVSTMSISRSEKAVLAADETSIGTDYPGLVIKQNVEEGETVSKGQVLFEVQSPQLNQSVNDKSVVAASLPFSINSTNQNIELKARDDGVVGKISYRAGSFVPVGGVIATVYTVGSLHVVGNFQLSPPDYARINKDSKVDLKLPDNSTQQATIFSIALVPNGEKVDTVVKARIKDADISDFRFAVGTPVNATLELTKNSWYQSVYNSLEQLFRPEGR